MYETHVGHEPAMPHFSWLRTDLKPDSGLSLVELQVPTGYMVTRDAIQKLYVSGIPGLKRAQFASPNLFVFFETVRSKMHHYQ